MTDLISKAELFNSLATVQTLDEAYAVIQDMPTKEPEVIRCKDCKNNYNTCLNHGVNRPMCDFTDWMLKENDFCSRAERRETCSS